jgi:hypothetical protein
LERRVSDSDSFIHEVSEAVRRDRLFAFLRRWGWAIGAALALVIGGAAVHEWRKARAQSAAEANGDALRAALLVSDPADRAARLATIAAEREGGTPVARLAQAGSLAAAGDREAAAGELAGLADDPAVTELYRALAALQRVMLLGDAMDPSERGATLEGLAAPGAPFRPLALEQRALLHLEAGDREAALADLEAVLAEPATPPALADRARQLIVAAGGALPLAGTPASAPVDG